MGLYPAMDGAPLMDIILSTENASKTFGGFTALKDVSVSFERGKLTAVIGPNGAGKSTFFNVISGAFPASSGRVLFDGQNMSGQPPHAFARAGIAKSFQITNVFAELTARENVRVAAQAMATRFQLFRARATYPELIEKADMLLDRVGIGHRRLNRARELAHGEQRSLEMAMALASDPKVLLLDEPTAGMSPEETRQMMDLILTLAGERTVIIVEHKMKLVMGIAQKIIVLHHGKLLAQGTPDEIKSHEEVKRVYLGQGKKMTAASPVSAAP
jgi:branched-chain amino acid transport system ATP-binding protein